MIAIGEDGAHEGPFSPRRAAQAGLELLLPGSTAKEHRRERPCEVR